MIRNVFGVIIYVYMTSINAGVIAEAASSRKPNEVIQAGYRMYTIYTGQDACNKSPKARKLEVVPVSVDLNVGDKWHPRLLVVHAYDYEGSFIPESPLLISIEERNDLVDTRGSEGYVKAIAAGRVLIQVQSYCDREPSKKVYLNIGTR